MKRFSWIYAFLLMSVCLSAQTVTQKGVTYRYNGKNPRTPIGSVTISYDGNKRSVLSDEKSGSFSLMLENLKMGDRIGLVTVKKREMMVFNQHAVDEWSIRKEPLVLILCNADEFERQKANLIEIGKREAKKKYDRQKVELEAKLSASQMKLQEYEAALDKAYDELERFHKNVGEYADLFARIDESEVDTLAQRALDLFNQGEVDEAIRLFEQGHYMEKLDKALKNSQQADQLKAIVEKAKEQTTQDSLKALQSLKAQIEAYKMNNEWDKAGGLLKGLADRLNSYDCVSDYAMFCLDQKIFDDAEKYLLRAKYLLENPLNKESIDNQGRLMSLLANMGVLYKDKKDYSKSEEYLKKAANICYNLWTDNANAYFYQLLVVSHNLASLYQETHRYQECISLNKEVLRIRRSLTEMYPQIYDVDLVKTLNNFANLYREIQRFRDCEELFNEALLICRRNVIDYPDDYEPLLAMTLNNYAGYYYDMKILPEAEKLTNEALSIYRGLANSNYQAYSSYVAATLKNLAGIYSITGRNEESELMYEQCLQLYYSLVASYPFVYMSDLAMTHNDLANHYAGIHRYEESVLSRKEAIQIFHKLALFHPSLYNDCYAEILGLQSYYMIITMHYLEAEQLAREGLSVDSSKHWIATNLAAALLFQGKYDEAEQIYRQYKDELKDSFLDDFKQFGEAGIIPREYEADVERIKKLLNE